MGASQRSTLERPERTTVKALTSTDVLDFQKPRRRRSQYLALENGDFVYLDEQDIATGTPLVFNYVTTVQGTEVRILLTQDAITAEDGWRAEVGDDGLISEDKAYEIARGINETSGIALAMAVERAHDLVKVAAQAAAEYQAASLARAAAIARVVSLCGGSQAEASRALGLDKTRVSRLATKAATLKESMQEMAVSAASAHDAMLILKSALATPAVD